MNSEVTQSLAQRLDNARLAAGSVERLTLEYPELSLREGYDIQAAGLTLRLSRGERQVGLKMGLTSEAKRQQMGLHSPVYGVLTDAMQIPDGGTVPNRGSIHPKIEPELAFRTGRDLAGKITLEEAFEACTGVTAALEILDSRFRDFKYFSLPDVVADNASSSLFVVGRSWSSLAGLKLDDLAMTMSVNGTAKQSSRSSAISGHPLLSVVQLCALLEEHGRSLPSGSIVLAGAATVAEPLHTGDRVTLTVEGLAPISVQA